MVRTLCTTHRCGHVSILSGYSRKTRVVDKQTPNMMQRIIQLPCTHAITFPKDIKVQGSTKQTVTLDIPVLVNSGPLEVSETLLLE